MTGKMAKRIRPECRGCLHRWTHICTDCIRNFYNSRDNGATTIDPSKDDCWEQEEHKRSDGKFTCDSCGRSSLTQDKCDRCDWPFPKEWLDLPIAQVPPMGVLEDDRL